MRIIILFKTLHKYIQYTICIVNNKTMIQHINQIIHNTTYYNRQY